MKQVVVSGQALCFLQAIFLGMALGVLFDVFRILRSAVPHLAVFIFLEDVLYFFLCAWLSFLFLDVTQSGEIRLFVLLGEGIGFTVYYFTLGALVFRCSQKVIATLKWLVKKIFSVIVRPFLFLLLIIQRVVFRPIVKFGKKIGKKVAFPLHRRLQPCKKMLYNLFYRTRKAEKKGRAERKKRNRRQKPCQEKQAGRKRPKRKRRASSSGR